MRADRVFGFVLAFILLASPPALAFCGLYVARADGALFNEASKVVMVRSGGETVITMSADYEGEPSEFAMIVPTPGVLRREDIQTVDPEIIAAVDAYSAPRLVEYQDGQPQCAPPILAEAMMRMDGVQQKSRGPAAFGVKIEAQYDVGEYDIVMLSATQSDGLIAYLRQEAYTIPDGAEAVIADYLKAGMKFFIARVDLAAHDGAATLSPLQLRVRQKEMMLPIRLGQVNAKGAQDLLILALTQQGRVEPVNYPLHKLHTDKEIPIFVRERFGEFYRAMFDRTVESVGGAALIMEYAWDMAWCDPCAANPPSNDQLAALGVDWLSGADNAGQDVFITRIHGRYDARFQEDIRFRVTEDRGNFQGRYILREPYSGPLVCADPDYMNEAEKREEIASYVTRVKRRAGAERETLAKLTGWSLRRIDQEIAKTLPKVYQ